MHYASDASLAFGKIEHIMRDVNWGWLMRYAHANGASFFFLVIYLHIFRGFYYSSYKAPREMIWLLGVAIGRASCRERVVSVRVDLGGRRIVKKKKKKQKN